MTPYVPIQLIALEHPEGRAHDHFRAFGYKRLDPKRRLIELALTPRQAEEIVRSLAYDAFPVIEVNEKHIILIGPQGTEGLNLIKDPELP